PSRARLPASMRAERWCWPTDRAARGSCPARSRSGAPDVCASPRAMSHVLVIDVGNSRMKWGLHGPRGWAALGVTPNTEIGTLALGDWHSLPRPLRAVGVNVAGEAARVRVEGQLTRWRLVPEWLAATESACGVVNRYARPSQLGADRWASLVAARRRALAATE